MAITLIDNHNESYFMIGLVIGILTSIMANIWVNEMYIWIKSPDENLLRFTIDTLVMVILLDFMIYVLPQENKRHRR